MLGPDDTPPFELLNAGGSGPCLIVCDHASKRIPTSLNDLGLAPRQRSEHIAWDIGASVMARRLSELLAAPALLAGYSRLVVDCNRYIDDPAAFAHRSDGVEVPGNAALNDAEKAQRTTNIYRPYHNAIGHALERFEETGVTPVFLSVHTMTDRMRDGARRAQEFTLCWARDDRLVQPVLERMRAKGAVVGDNEPYSLDLGEDYTVPEQAMRRGLAHLQIEVRQDLVAEDEGAVHWATMIYEAVADLIADPKLRSAKHYWP